METKFNLGMTVVTRGVDHLLRSSTPFHNGVMESLRRHADCDWGDVDPEDKMQNDFALSKGLRLFSAYVVDDTKIWIITEADRSSTTILFPDEY